MKNGFRNAEVEAKLREQLERLKQRVGMGYEVEVELHPGLLKFKDGKPLEEEVVGNKILIYAEDPERVKELLAHGLIEWALNEYSKLYRALINKFIELFEEEVYWRKERLIDALTRLLLETSNSGEDGGKKSIV